MIVSTLKHLGLTGLLVVAGSHAQQDVASGPEEVRYEDLTERPGRRLGETVRFWFSFEREIEDWNPYLTRFGKHDWSLWRGWSDEQFPWELEDFEDPIAYVFCPRDGRLDRKLARSERYERFRVDAILREFTAGRPWLEVVDLERTDEEITEGAIIHASRAVDEMAKEQWVLALDDLERARIGTLPPRAEAELRRLSEVCERALDGPGAE